MKVYVLTEGAPEEIIVGVYSTKKKADNAAKHYKNNYFRWAHCSVSEFVVDKSWWKKLSKVPK